jgi:hypothetical protein
MQKPIPEMISVRASKRGIPRTVRIVVVAVVVSILTLVASSVTVSEWVLARFPEYASVFRRLPRYEGQSGDPDLGLLSARIDAGAVRRAAKLVPDDALYYVQSPEPFTDGLERVARLYFLPAVAVRHPSDADWILSFRSRSLPRGVAKLESIRLSRDLSLSRVAPH